MEAIKPRATLGRGNQSDRSRLTKNEVEEEEEKEEEEEEVATIEGKSRRSVDIKRWTIDFDVT